MSTATLTLDDLIANEARNLKLMLSNADTDDDRRRTPSARCSPLPARVRAELGGSLAPADAAIFPGGAVPRPTLDSGAHAVG